MEAPAPGRCFEITVPAQEGGAGAPAAAVTATTIHAMRLAEADAAVWGAIMLQESDLGPLVCGTQNYLRRQRLVIFGGNEDDLHAFEVMHRVQISRTFYVSEAGVRCLMVKAAANAGRVPGPACVRWRAALRGAVEADEEEENEGKGSEGEAPDELDLTEEPAAAVAATVVAAAAAVAATAAAVAAAVAAAIAVPVSNADKGGQQMQISFEKYKEVANSIVILRCTHT
jgi:hypothetical protein